MFFSMEYESPIGKCLLVSDKKHLVGLWLEGQKYYCPLKESNHCAKKPYRKDVGTGNWRCSWT